MLEKAAWLLTLIFFALKIGGVGDVADWSWWAVVAPVLINYSLLIPILLLAWIKMGLEKRRNRPWYERL